MGAVGLFNPLPLPYSAIESSVRGSLRTKSEGRFPWRMWWNSSLDKIQLAASSGSARRAANATALVQAVTREARMVCLPSVRRWSSRARRVSTPVRHASSAPVATTFPRRAACVAFSLSLSSLSLSLTTTAAARMASRATRWTEGWQHRFFVVSRSWTSSKRTSQGTKASSPRRTPSKIVRAGGSSLLSSSSFAVLTKQHFALATWTSWLARTSPTEMTLWPAPVWSFGSEASRERRKASDTRAPPRKVVLEARLFPSRIAVAPEESWQKSTTRAVAVFQLVVVEDAAVTAATERGATATEAAPCWRKRNSANSPRKRRVARLGKTPTTCRSSRSRSARRRAWRTMSSTSFQPRRVIVVLLLVCPASSLWSASSS
mmetsp:Transcript_35698/g.114194  ORF Transcript_35698/g.114194 Transcript_35698/m.114194 type:complete len:375 (-) Transcript_35698:526-1650(-)